MTKGDLWDDSALTIAFDQAMSKYKKMHIKGSEESSSGSGAANANEKNLDALNSMETDGGSGQMLNTIDGETDKLAVATENETLDTQEPQEYVEVPNGTPFQNHTQSYSSSQAPEEYESLWKQYYELEGKRLQIWEKLQQYGQWHYNNYSVGTSGSCMLSSTVPASQDQYYSSQACSPAYPVVCCPSECQSSTTSCCLPSCSLRTSAGLFINSSLATGCGRVSEDADIVNMGMEAAEKALSTSREGASDRQLKDQGCSQREPNTNGETDLTEVLNAWYSAGFYTGKYLTEKSLAKPRSS